MQRIGWGVLAAALVAGCVDGVGNTCRVHGDCVPGLACVANACEACEGGGDGVACQPVDLVVRSCEPAADPVAGATKLRVSVTGEGLDPLVREFDLASRQARTPAIPFGRARRVSVEAIASDGGALARGESGVFDMVRDRPIVAPVVWVRRIGSFTPTQPLDDSASCARLETARAGHTSTLLPDGRVVFAGGYAFDSTGLKVAVSSVEIFDPNRGTFREVPNGLKDARDGHTATLLADGRVLFAGGVRWTAGAAVPLATAEILDPKEQTLTLVNMKRARAFHAAARLGDGSVLLAGGAAGPGLAAMDSTEVFRPTAGTADAFALGPRLQSPRRGHAIVERDGLVLLVGGHDGTSPLATVEAVSAVTATPATDWRLSVAKAQPLAVSFVAGGHDGVLVVGAPQTVPAPIDELWDFFPWSASAAAPARDPAAAPMARTDACAAAFRGGAIVVGGRGSDGALLSSADVFTVGDAGLTATPALRDISAPRANASCVTLADGSVLVSGGEGRELGRPFVSFEAEIFQP